MASRQALGNNYGGARFEEQRLRLGGAPQSFANTAPNFEETHHRHMGPHPTPDREADSSVPAEEREQGDGVEDWSLVVPEVVSHLKEVTCLIPVPGSLCCAAQSPSPASEQGAHHHSRDGDCVTVLQKCVAHTALLAKPDKLHDHELAADESVLAMCSSPHCAPELTLISA